MKLSGETLTLFDLFAEELLNDHSINEEVPISKSYLVKRAISEIPLKNISWEKVRDFDFEEALVISNKGIQTALNLERSMIDILEQLRMEFKEEFETKRIYRPFVIKLIIKAAIIKQKGKINEVMKFCDTRSIKILQQNLNFNNRNISSIIEEIKNKNPEIIFFQEYNKSYHSEVDTLQNYSFYYPIDYKADDDDESMLCLLAIKKGHHFEQRKRDGITVYLRYIEGKVAIDDFELDLFFIHVPQTFPKATKGIEYNQDRVEYKGECLFAAYQFTEEYKKGTAFVGGDFNVDIRKNENDYKYTNRFQGIFAEIYRNLHDTANYESTWNQRKYDYALVSDLLKDSQSHVMETSSDHHMIITEINYHA